MSRYLETRLENTTRIVYSHRCSIVGIPIMSDDEHLHLIISGLLSAYWMLSGVNLYK